LPRIGAFDHNGGRLALLPSLGRAAETVLRIWDVDRHKELLTIPLRDRQVERAAFSPNTV
jgi:hypothetical protein